jgi:methylaspartate mutase sigma subunit
VLFVSQADVRAPRVVIGTIGGDSHVVGVKILGDILSRAGYQVTNLGAMAPAEDFIKAAIETDARIILVSSLSGNAEFYCRDLRGMCEEAGLENTLLYVGGNISIGHLPWPDVEKRFIDLRFNRAFPPQTKGNVLLAALRDDLGVEAPDPC